MNKKILTYLSLLIIAVFIGYIVLDTTRQQSKDVAEEGALTDYDENWEMATGFSINDGTPCAVAVSTDGKVFIGGDSFISCFDRDLKKIWSVKTTMPVTSVSVYDDQVYASTRNHLFVVNSGGIQTGELGPWDENSIITSVAAASSTIAVADANNRVVYIIDKGGEVLDIIGNNENHFIIPSPYFDVVNTGSGYFIANTGQRRIEKWSSEGGLISFFGESGLAPDAFCGCCNPAHMSSFPGGFITAEKGINRIKVIDSLGRFVEFVSAKNNFKPSVPLDIASDKGVTIYAVNPSDSKLYVFKRKLQNNES